jgi:hypothetical protein
MATLATATTQPLPPHFWFIFGALAVLSCAMVYAMVQFSRAVLSADALTPDDRFTSEAISIRHSLQIWRAIYVIIWAGLVAIFLALFHTSRNGDTAHNYLILLVVVGGFWLVHWFILRFALALQRAGAVKLSPGALGAESAADDSTSSPSLPVGEGRGEGAQASDTDDDSVPDQDVATRAPPASGIRTTPGICDSTR